MPPKRGCSVEGMHSRLNLQTLDSVNKLVLAVITPDIDYGKCRRELLITILKCNKDSSLERLLILLVEKKLSDFFVQIV